MGKQQLKSSLKIRFSQIYVFKPSIICYLNWFRFISFFHFILILVILYYFNFTKVTFKFINLIGYLKFLLFQIYFNKKKNKKSLNNYIPGSLRIQSIITLNMVNLHALHQSDFNDTWIIICSRVSHDLISWLSSPPQCTFTHDVWMYINYCRWTMKPTIFY